MGIKEEKYQIIIPWQDSWQFRASSVVEVGYIKVKAAV
jgi:hypothetical protein